MSRPSSPRYFLASIALLSVLVGLYALSTGRRTQRELAGQLEQTALALAETVEVASRNAVRSNALMEEMIAQRLLDNARLIDAFLAFPPVDAEEVAGLAARNRLRRVDLLDYDGRPYRLPRPPRGMMGRHMRGPAEGEPPHPGAAMMRFMWGRRWGHGPRAAEDGDRPLPRAIQDRTFWEGTVFGVAIGARSFPGIIAVHADADYILNFSREIGVERQLEEAARQSGVLAVTLLGPDLAVLAHADPGRIGVPADDDLARAALAAGAARSRMVRPGGGPEVLEVARPVALGGEQPGLLRIALSTEPLERAWRRDVQSSVVLGVAVLLAGALGLGAIFYVQQRHLRERRELEAQMASRERLAALGDVAAAFAHEVRNPLNAVSVGLQRLRAEFAPEPGAEYVQFVDLMQGEVRRLNAIVEQFIALARPLPLTPGPVRVDQLLRELAALIEGDAGRTGVEVRVAIPADLPLLTADRDRLKQVLLNLALNGIQALPGGGTLTLGAEVHGGHCTLTVADTGPGIPPDVLPRIFDPYFTTKPGGLGLGLAIARRIVEAHGGIIEADSGPGRGTRFRLRLPLGAR